MHLLRDVLNNISLTILYSCSYIFCYLQLDHFFKDFLQIMHKLW